MSLVNSTIFSFFLLFALSGRADAKHFANLKFANIDPAKIQESSTNEIELLEYREARPPEVTVTCAGKVEYCKLDDLACSKVIQLKLKAGATSSQKNKLEFQCEGSEPESVTLNLLGKRFPSFELSGSSTVNANFILSPETIGPHNVNLVEGDGNLLILGPKGQIVFYRSLPFPATDFRVHHIHGKIFYSYQQTKEGSINLSSSGVRYILNSDFEVIKKLPMQTDIHEFLLLSLDDYFVMEYSTKKDRSGVCYVDPIIRHFKNGKKIFELGAKELLSWGIIGGSHYQIEYKGHECKQPVHTNSLQLIDSQHLFISTAYSFLLFNLETRKVEWIFGGTDTQFPWPSKYNYFFAHTAFWDSKSHELSFFVNRLSGVAESSKFLKVKLDIKNRKLLDFSILADNFGQSTGMGSGQLLENGAVSLGLGIKAQNSDPDILEVLDGKPTIKIHFLAPIDCSGYRVYRDE